jgi:acetyl-CoA acyltransferase 1
VQIATAIQTGLIEVGIGAGFESMSKNYGQAAGAPTSKKIVDQCQSAADCLIPMG